ncbi:TPA: hypothetical protein DEP94_03315 [Candidatus Nomurabacteria bacterium]|nr:hypothetical protein [Candidatus Nomurabacteria bacterium]
MKKKVLVPTSRDIILNLKVLAKEKEAVRRKLAVTAAKLAATAKKLAVTAKEKEYVRRKLEVSAREKEVVRRKLEVTAAKLAATAEKLARTAKEKESARSKLAITAAELALTAKKLAVTAKEKEAVRRKLAVTAAKLAVTAEKLTVTAAKLAATAEKLAITAEEKEDVRQKLVITAAKLAATAEEKEDARRKLAVTAEEKEDARRKLAVTAEEKEDVRQKLVITAAKLAATAEEKEEVRRNLLVTANKLKEAYETLENKVLERTKSLEMARAKEEAILLSIGDGLLVTDEKGDIILINRTAEKLLGKKSTEVVGKGFVEVMPLEDEKGERVLLEKHPVSVALSGSTAISARTNSYYVRKDNTKFPVASIATPVILNKKVIGTIKVFRDVTSERDIDKAKTEFVSLASHQLRTPLTSIGWYSEMLLKGAESFSGNQKVYLEEIYQGNQRMVELVNTLLDVSRIELGTFMSEPKPTDIVLLAQAVLDEQKQNIKEKKFIIIKKFIKGPSVFLTDPKLLHIVFQNLITNAVKYTPNGGTIEFTISFDKKKTILIKVSDTGYGIPKNQQKQIFTKLFRADNARDKDTSGTGLGLYIVKSIVENTGGKIWFNSPAHKSSSVERAKEDEELNPGTTFYVALTLDKVNAKK